MGRLQAGAGAQEVQDWGAGRGCGGTRATWVNMGEPEAEGPRVETGCEAKSR